MNKLKIEPLGKKLLMDIPETKAGALEVKQGKQIQEQGTILAVGPEVNDKHIGETIQFKAWAVDIITIDGQTFYYLDADSTAICGKVK